MSLKERLFGLPWESKDAATRARVIAESNDPRLGPALPGLARNDPDPVARLAALKRLDDEVAWLEARAGLDDAPIRAAADRALQRWVATEPGDLEARRAWLATISDGDVLRIVAAQAVDEPLRRDALAKIQAQGFLGDRYCEEASDTLAAELLERIDQASTLKRIAAALRTRHKQRHHAVLERLAALEGEDKHETRDALARELIERIEKLARGQYSGDRRARADDLQQRWSQMNDPDPALARRFDGAMRIVRRALEPRPEPAPVEVEAVAPAEAGVLEAPIEALQALAAQALADDSADQLHRISAAFERARGRLDRIGETEQKQIQQFNALAEEVRARLNSADAATTARKASPAPKPSAADPARLEALEAALNAADEALESGEIPLAHEAIARARSAHDKIEKRFRPGEAAGRLNRMAGRLKEMRDWQHWSNNKLRERLIERAEQLDPAELHPDAVTERLKELRDRWRELDARELLPGEKREFAAPHAQWRRFQAACKQAFEGAKPYLEKRSEVRSAALDELKAFLDAAEELLKRETIERDVLVRHQRAAREGIRNLEQVPPKARGRMARRLRDLMDAISKRIDAASEAVEQEKRRLVAEARKLAHEKDRAVAIDRAKALQAAWKQAGRGRRKVEDALWKEFREPIDPLFEGLKQERDEQRQAERATFDALKALCEKAEALVEGPEDALEASAGPLAGIEEAFGEQGRVPPTLRKRMDQALRRYRERIKALSEAREQAARAHLDALADALQASSAALEDGKRPTIDLPEVPSDDALGQQMKARLEAFLAADAKPELLADEVRRGTDAARQVCVEMECLSGLESPEADKRLRMDYQLSRLSSRLGEGAARPDLDSERAALLRRWLDSFPHATAAHAELAKRFRAADQILKQMSAS